MKKKAAGLTFNTLRDIPINSGLHCKAKMKTNIRYMTRLNSIIYIPNKSIKPQRWIITNVEMWSKQTNNMGGGHSLQMLISKALEMRL